MKSLFALLLLSSTAFAADMPVKARPFVTAPVYDWTAMYIGLEGGMNLGRFSPFCSPTVCGPVATEVNLDDNNWFVGGHVGYALQVNQSIVIGPEVGVQYWGFKSKATVPVTAIADPLDPTLQTKIDWLAYANLRAGLLVSPNFLVYLTGGPAWAHVKGDINLNIANLDTANAQSVFGVNIGGGIAFKLSPTVILSGEYRHYDFGKVTVANPVFNLTGIGSSDRLTVEQAMGRLSFQLN